MSFLCYWANFIVATGQNTLTNNLVTLVDVSKLQLQSTRCSRRRPFYVRSKYFYDPGSQKNLDNFLAASVYGT